MWTRVLCGVSMAAVTVFAQTLIRFGLKRTGAITSTLWAHPVRFVTEIMLQPYVLAGILVQVVGLFLWLTMLSRMKLGTAIALAGAFTFILSGISSALILHEPLRAREWVGIGLIVLGVAVLSMGGSS